MAVRFVLGRAGTGKTTYMMKEIGDRLSAGSVDTPLIYLVPEQATFQAEYDLATRSAAGAVVQAQVLSFGRLAYRITQEMGGGAKLPVDELGKQMVLRMLLEKHRNELQIFQRASLQPGFAGQLARMISECKRYGVALDQLAEQEWSGGTLAQKLHDLRLVMAAYDGYLSGQYYDTDDMLTMVTEQIAASAYVGKAEVWIDGFSGFTRQEYMVIEQLMRHARQVTIALSLDPDEREQAIDELALFYPTAETYRRLTQLADEAGVQMKPPVLLPQAERFVRSPWLAQLEASYFSWGSPASCPPAGREDEVTLVTAANRRAEVQAAALQMLSLAREEGYRWRDMAVLLREIGTYADEISSVFREYEIPFFLDQKRSVLHHPLVELVRSALEVVTSRWKYEAVFRCLKTDLVQPEEEMEQEAMRAEVDLLENYVLAYGIQGAQWSDDAQWRYHPAGDQRYERIDEIRRRYARPLLVLDRAAKAAAKRNVRAITTALYQFLADLHVPERLERWQQEAEQRGDLETAREHPQVWNDLMELFDQVVEVLGDECIDLTSYSRILDSGLESIQLGLVPPALDQVLVGSMERSRQPDVKAAFVLGVNDGVIPLRPSEDSILDEAERERLAEAGVELAPSAKQRLLAEQFLLYQAFTRPSERLWLSCALADEEGKGLLPSAVFQRVKETLPGIHVRFFADEPNGEAESDLRLLGTPQQVFVHLLTLFRQVKKGTTLTPFWWAVYDWFVKRAESALRQRWLLSGLNYTNRAAPLAPEISRQLYGQELRLSVSRLERFQTCPFSHFSSHGLRLAERELYRLERFDVGELFHASLKRAVERMQQERIDWANITERHGMALADQVVDEIVPLTRGSILSRTARYRFLAGKLKRAVGRAIVVLGEHARRSRFVPVGLEVSFGPNAELPGLTLQLEDGIRLQLIGRIDRVDQSIGEGRRLLRVIDYKSGSKKLALSDIWNGLNLQLLVYLDVVVSHAEKWLGEKADIGGVFYYQVADPFITAKNILTADELAQERSKKLRMKGWMLADPEVARLMDEQTGSGSSDILPFGLKKDGSFTSRSSVATPEQFSLLTSYVRQTIKQVTKRMTGGEIEISPYVQGPYLACQNCSYKPVCQFDQLHEGNSARPIVQARDDELWTMIRQVVSPADDHSAEDARPEGQ
ncbi:helicase-exonuclease AddAB subunit AddB [Brevibacillus humidisoli]|uniref:helicase-exonuclease AddAB subunit AddB n=1 Tax=Brevibacillus humidisoli TaxID=2895522 RepID=UPI001E33915A|nr:helicase-exonuclease AddAB subunit AddB [Brevibacillus humidisoli]UFJ39810.1 helicase-exonuclease AddAB subunit AddB [Brevibacillus humidisoli]